jgi:hypothetical protein
MTLRDEQNYNIQEAIEHHFIKGQDPQGQKREVAVDMEGRLLTRQPTFAYPFEGAGAISMTTTIDRDFGGRQVELVALDVKISAAPTTAENLTVTLQSNRHTTVFDTVYFTEDPSASSATSILQIWEVPVPLELGDELVVAYTNTDGGTIGGKLVVRPVS